MPKVKRARYKEQIFTSEHLLLEVNRKKQNNNNKKNTSMLQSSENVPDMQNPPTNISL